MASDPVTTPPDTKLTLDSDPVKTPPPDTKSTVDSDSITTPPDTKPTMTPDPAAVSPLTTPIVTSEMVEIPREQASFASLPREIRDKIYRLAIPHSWDIKLLFGAKSREENSYQILSPRASNSTYAKEACAMLFKRNSFRINVWYLQVLLGEAGINQVCKFRGYHSLEDSFCGKRFVVTVGGSFEVKPCLRDVVIVIYMEDEMDWLAGCIGLLLECPALQKINVVLHGGRFGLKRVIEIISGAFKALTKKFGRRLIFNLADDNWMGLVEPNEELIGNLEQLETLAANVNLDLEFKDSDYENDTEYYTSDSEEDER